VVADELVVQHLVAGGRVVVEVGAERRNALQRGDHQLHNTHNMSDNNNKSTLIMKMEDLISARVELVAEGVKDAEGDEL